MIEIKRDIDRDKDRMIETGIEIDRKGEIDIREQFEKERKKRGIQKEMQWCINTLFFPVSPRINFYPTFKIDQNKVLKKYFSI